MLKTARNIFDATHNRPDRVSTERAFRWEYWNAGVHDKNTAYFSTKLIFKLVGILFTALFLSLSPHASEGGGQYAHLRTPGASFFGPPIEGEDETIMAELKSLGIDTANDGVFPALVDLITSFGQRQLGERTAP